MRAESRAQPPPQAPLSSLAPDDVRAFYAHARTLHAALDAHELTVRLAPGDALLTNNHRVRRPMVSYGSLNLIVACSMTRLIILR